MVKQYNHKYALLVGINKAQGASALQYPGNDVANLHRALLKRGFKADGIKTVRDGGGHNGQKVHSDDVLRAVDSIVGETRHHGGDSLLIFHFSGHGRTPRDNQSQLFMEYAAIGEPHLRTNDLARNLSHHQGRTLVIIDACNASDPSAMLGFQRDEQPTEADAEGLGRGMNVHSGDPAPVRTTWGDRKYLPADWIVASSSTGVTREYHEFGMGMLSYAVYLELLRSSRGEYKLSRDGLIDGVKKRCQTIAKEDKLVHSVSGENYVITGWADDAEMQSRSDIWEAFRLLRSMNQKQIGAKLDILDGEFKTAPKSVLDRIAPLFSELHTYVKSTTPRELLHLRIEHRLRLLIEMLDATGPDTTGREDLHKFALRIKNLFDENDEKPGTA